MRREAKLATSGKYTQKIYAKKSLEDRRKDLKETFPVDPTDDVFATPAIKEEKPQMTKRPAQESSGKRKRRRT